MKETLAVSKTRQLQEARAQELAQCELEISALLDKYGARLDVLRIVQVVNGMERTTFRIQALDK